MHKSRWILQTLILSIALNAALACVFFYFLIRDNPLHFAYRPKEVVRGGAPPVSAPFLERLQHVPFEQLLDLLDDERKVEQGYRIRDFALGALAAFHDLDVERALGRGKIAKRTWEHEKQFFLLYPGLQEEDFDTIVRFVKTEKWPLTARGLYHIIQCEGMEQSDPALLSFFCHTPEFVLLETLFARTQLPIQKRALLALSLETGWETLSSFAAKQQAGADFSCECRQTFLLEAITKGSKTAAYLLLITDSSFAYKELEDVQIAQILDLITAKTQESLQFVQLIAASPRSDVVREKAFLRIAEYTGTIPSEIAGHFYEKPGLKKLRPVFREQPPASPAPSTHIVQQGESLWLIARRYRVSVDALMQLNKMQTAVIQPGKSLRIPPS